MNPGKSRAEFEPQLVVVYANSAQSYQLVQSATMGAGHEVLAIASGGTDCGGIVARTALSDRCQFTIPSGGGPVFGATQDHEVVFTMPWDKAQALLQAMQNIDETGFRYPTFIDLRRRLTVAPMLEMSQKVYPSLQD